MSGEVVNLRGGTPLETNEALFLIADMVNLVLASLPVGFEDTLTPAAWAVLERWAAWVPVRAVR